MTAPLHPAFDPDFQPSTPCLEFEYEIERELAVLREMQTYRSQVESFIRLAVEIREEARETRGAVERLLQIIAGEIGER